MPLRVLGTLRVRSISIARSNSATAVSTRIVIRPAALVSWMRPAVRQCTRTPMPLNASTVARASVALQPSRSCFVDTSTSLSSSLLCSAPNAGALTGFDRAADRLGHDSSGLQVEAGAPISRRSRDAFGMAGKKKDVLLKEQLPAWFAAVQQLPNETTAAYLQTLLLIGSRRGELLELKWSDLNLQWRGITIRDKVEGDRQIPLTPYVGSLLQKLPRCNAYVFASSKKGSETHLSDPNPAMNAACAVAGVSGLTLHGLRRSFKSLTEWLEIPTGVVAQIMGHKPSATAEKHYTIRPLDLLRVHHESIEAWILEQAKVPFTLSKEDAPALSLVA